MYKPLADFFFFPPHASLQEDERSPEIDAAPSRCIKIIGVHVLFLKPRASAERPRRAQKLIDSRDHETRAHTHTHTGTGLFFSPRTLFPEMASSPRKLLTQQTLLLRAGASPLPASAEKGKKVSAVADDLISMGAPLGL